MTELDRAMQELLGKINRKKQLEAEIREQEDRRWSLRITAERLQAVMEQEQADVDRLEGHSLAAFFYQVVGKMDERLTKEREEAYTARVKYDAAARELNGLEEDLDRNRAELDSLLGCEEEYQRLLEEKAELLKKSGSAAGEELLRLEERLGWLTHQRRELEEAVMAGETALRTADSILSSLDSAQGWATWDVLGGGIISDMAKYSKLDEAQHKVENLQLQLQRFKTELADVTIETDMQVGVDGFLCFADYFFDNIFTDWAVMDRISGSREQVSRTRAQIISVLQGLQTMQHQTEKERADVRGRIDKLIRNAGM